MSAEGDLIRRADLGLHSPFEPPATGGVEAVLARLFAEALRIDLVGATDDFFDLGGDSLAAEALGLSVEQTLGRSFPVSMIAECGTPRALAAWFDGGEAQNPGAKDARPPIFAVHGQTGYMLPKPEFYRGLGPGESFHLFELPGLRDGVGVCDTIEEIAQRYLEQVVQRQPTGSVRLAAFCGGSMIAAVLATALRAQGRQVPLLVLIDPNLTIRHDRVFREGHWHTPRRAAWLEDPGKRALNLEFHRNRVTKDVLAGADPMSKRFPGMRFSVEARARLATASQHHDPVRYEGRTLILASRERVPIYSARATLWDEVFPNRTVEIVGETHREVLNSPGGRTADALRAAFSSTAGT